MGFRPGKRGKRKRNTYIRGVDDVCELNGVSSANGLAGLVLGDTLGAVEVVQDSNDGDGGS